MLSSMRFGEPACRWRPVSRERAKALIDEALVIVDAVLYAKSGNGWPKAPLRAIRGHIAEAGFAVVRSDFSRASERLDEAIRALENAGGKGE